jgi:hypothetical protein
VQRSPSWGSELTGRRGRWGSPPVASGEVAAASRGVRVPERERSEGRKWVVLFGLGRIAATGSGPKLRVYFSTRPIPCLFSIIIHFYSNIFLTILFISSSFDVLFFSSQFLCLSLYMSM